MKPQNNNQQLYELKKKDPVTAVILSLLITGLGQVYAGSVVKGIIMFIITMALWTVFLGWIMWVISPIDAYTTVVDQNKILALELGVNL